MRMLRPRVVADVDALLAELKGMCGGEGDNTQDGGQDDGTAGAAHAEASEGLQERYARILHAVGYFDPTDARTLKLDAAAPGVDGATTPATANGNDGDTPMPDAGSGAAAADGGDAAAVAEGGAQANGAGAPAGVDKAAQLAEVEGIRVTQMHDEVSFIAGCVMRWYGKRKPLTAEKRKELTAAKAARASALQASVATLRAMRTEIFAKFCAPVDQEDLPMMRDYCGKLTKKQGTAIMDAFLGAETWDPVLYAIRDAIDAADNMPIQKRRQLLTSHLELLRNPPFASEAGGRPTKPKVGEYPDESTLELTPLPEATRLDLDPMVGMLFGEIVLTWLHLHVLAKVVRITRFPLHFFVDIIANPKETSLMKLIYTQLLCVIEEATEADSNAWMEHVLSLVASDTHLDAPESDATTSESSEEGEESDSDEDSDDEDSSDASSSEASSSAEDTDSDEDESSEEEEDVDSDDSTFDELTDRQRRQKITNRRKQIEARKQKRAEEKAARAKKRELKAKQAEKKRLQAEAEAAKKKEEEEAQRKAREAEKEAKRVRREARRKYMEENADALAEEARRARAALVAKEAAQQDFLTEAIRQAVERGRELLPRGNNLEHWDITLRVLVLRGLLRMVVATPASADVLKELEAHPANAKASLHEREKKANALYEKRVQRIKDRGTVIEATETTDRGDAAAANGDDTAKKPARGGSARKGRKEKEVVKEVTYDEATMEKLKKEAEKFELELKGLRFATWEDVCSNTLHMMPIGSDRYRRLYFKFPTDCAIYVFTPAVERRTLAGQCRAEDDAAWRVADAAHRDARIAEQTAEFTRRKDEHAREVAEMAAAKVEAEKAAEDSADEDIVMKPNPKGARGRGRKKQDDEDALSEPEDPAAAQPVPPAWVALHGEWSFYDPEDILSALSTEGRHERELKVALEVIRDHLIYQDEHIMHDKFGGELRRYVNKFTSRQGTYLSADDCANP